MKPSPEELEKMIHQALRSAAPHRAPRSLEGRVLAAIEARASLPWWKQSFAQWPVAARIAFVVASAGLAKLALMAVVWVMAGFDNAQFTSAFSTQFAWVDTGLAVISSVGDAFSTLYRSIPPLWLYGGLAFFAMMYVALFGLGAAAYRTFQAQR
ncbi:MAG: hypothetical protein JWM32_1933 [Verrucomicrobia bacterium]|nr:hypothetical protein [Verrucomicrobiota bacterium]